MLNKLVVLLVAAGMSMTLCAMPTAEEQEKVRPLVQGLMKPDLDAMKQGKKSRSDVAKSAMDLYSKADSPAAKMLLARNALNLYAKAGEYEAAESALNALLAAVPDYPAPDLAELLEKTLHPIPLRAAPNLRARLAAVKDKAQAASQLKKLLPVYESLAEGPKRKACAARIAAAYVALDDWPNALKYFAVSDSLAASAASTELNPKDADRANEAAADAWWAVELPKKDAKLAAALRAHSAALYAKALPTLSGLSKVQAERRIQEVKDASLAASDSPAPTAKSSTSSSSSVGTAKYYGVELVGDAVKEVKGRISGFSDNSFAKIRAPFDQNRKSIEVVIAFETGATVDKSGGLLSASVQCRFAPLFIKGGQLVGFLSSNGATWDVSFGKPISLALKPKTGYRIKVTWDGNTYTWYQWNSNNWRRIKDISCATPFKGSIDLQLGKGCSSNTYFSGAIDLNMSYICIDDKLWWEGAKGAYNNANH